jgi:hypothetical protein
MEGKMMNSIFLNEGIFSKETNQQKIDRLFKKKKEELEYWYNQERDKKKNEIKHDYLEAMIKDYCILEFDERYDELPSLLKKDKFKQEFNIIKNKIRELKNIFEQRILEVNRYLKSLDSNYSFMKEIKFIEDFWDRFERENDENGGDDWSNFMN